MVIFVGLQASGKSTLYRERNTIRNALHGSYVLALTFLYIQ
jgi:predicted kinase